MSATPDEETIRLMEKAIEYANRHPKKDVRVVVPHSHFEGSVRRLMDYPPPGNILFIPYGNESREAFKIYHGEKFLVHPWVLRCMGEGEKTDAIRAMVP